MKTIPLSALRGACRPQMIIVQSEWPDGIPVTQKALNRAIALKLDLNWAAKKLLKGQALAEYEKVTRPAWAEYEKVKGPAWAEYEKVKGPAVLRFLKAKED